MTIPPTTADLVTTGAQAVLPKLPRVGFDRLAWTPHTHLDGDKSKPRKPVPMSLPGFKCSGDHVAPLKSNYKRFARFRSATDPAGPLIDLFYKPMNPATVLSVNPPSKPTWNLRRPLFRVVIRSTMYRLLDLDEVAPIIKHLTSELGYSLQLREVELSIDFPGSSALTERLQNQLAVPRARRNVVGKPEWEWTVQGSRRSAYFVRLYSKRESGLHATRIELHLRPGGLRRLHLTDLNKLRSAPWTELVTRRLRFRNFRLLKRDGVSEQLLGHQIKASGLKRVLSDAPESHRERIRRRLDPDPIESTIRALLEAFEQRLKSGPEVVS